MRCKLFAKIISITFTFIGRKDYDNNEAISSHIAETFAINKGDFLMLHCRNISIKIDFKFKVVLTAADQQISDSSTSKQAFLVTE